MNLRLPAPCVFVAVMIMGCSSNEPPPDDRVTASSAQKSAEPPDDTPSEGESAPSSTCGNYEAKECDPQVVIDYVKQHPDDSLHEVIGCGECGVALAAAGAVAVGSVEAPPVAISLGAVYGVVKASSDCQQCLKFSEESGIADVLSCVVAPCKYSEEGNQKDCEQSAPEGQIGFKNRGNFECSFTSDPVEAECRLKCFEGSHIMRDESGKCWCKLE